MTTKNILIVSIISFYIFNFVVTLVQRWWEDVSPK